MIKQRKLGDTGLMVSELGVGCSSFWATSAFPEKRALAILDKAIEEGVNIFDTGSNYAGGQAERRLGKAVKEHNRDDLVIGTKAGSWVAPNGSFYRDFTPEAVRTGVEGSLKRLDLDHVDLLHLHAPPGEVLSDDLLYCLERLKQDGLVRFCGIYGSGEASHRCVLENEVFSTVMFDYNLLCTWKTKEVDELAAAGKGFIAATPLAQALYSNKLFKPTSMADLWYIARALKNHRNRVVRGFSFRFVNKIPGWTGAEVAIGYVLSKKNVSCAIFGTTNMNRLMENLRAGDRELPQEVIDRIEAV